MALIDIILSGMHLVRTTSIGTGSGRLGAIVALVFGAGWRCPLNIGAGPVKEEPFGQ